MYSRHKGQDLTTIEPNKDQFEPRSRMPNEPQTQRNAKEPLHKVTLSINQLRPLTIEIQNSKVLFSFFFLMVGHLFVFLFLFSCVKRQLQEKEKEKKFTLGARKN